MPTLGPTELIILLIIILVLFGANKVPQLMKGLGDGMKEFKKATRDDDDVNNSNSTKTPTNGPTV